MSNTERSRLFRKNNPGYDARRKAKERGSIRHDAAIMKAALQAEQATTRPEPLLLPAPTEPMPLLIGMPDAREAVCVERDAA